MGVNIHAFVVANSRHILTYKSPVYIMKEAEQMYTERNSMKNTRKWLLILLPMLWAALAGCSMAGLPQGSTPLSSGESLSY